MLYFYYKLINLPHVHVSAASLRLNLLRINLSATIAAILREVTETCTCSSFTTSTI